MKRLFTPSCTRRSTNLHEVKKIIDKQRFVHDGALPGGFSKEALSQWAQYTWNDTKEPYVDLFSAKISLECTEYLKHQSNPSSDLTKCFFGSNRFLPERCMLTLIFRENYALPDVFSTDSKFLAWSAAVNTPLETICTWELRQTVIGCTMIGFDPQLRRVYHGNCIHSSFADNDWFKASLPFHNNYAQFLLNGMVNQIEAQSRRGVSSDKKIR